MVLSRAMIILTLIIPSFYLIPGQFLPAQVTVDQIWLDSFNGENNGQIEDDYATDMAIDSLGNVYVSGLSFEQVQSNLYSPRFVTLSYAADGTKNWERFWRPGGGSFAGGAEAIGIDAEDNIIVAGAAHGSDDWGVIKYSPSGATLWTQIYEANSTFLTHPDDLFVDAAGNSYMVGYVGSSLNPPFGALVKIDADGNIDWAAEYYGPEFDGGSLNSVVVDAAGNVYAAGSSVVSGFASQATITKFDSNGNLLWQKTDGSLFQVAHDIFSDIDLDLNGNVVVAGTFGNNTSAGPNIAIAKYDPDGNEIWTEEFDGIFGSDRGVKIAIDSQDQIVVAGTTAMDFDDDDTVILKFDQNGSLTWSTILAGTGLGNDRPSDLIINSQDQIFFTGIEEPFAGVDYQITAAIDSAGQLLWKELYGGPDQCCSYGSSIALGCDDCIFTAGSSFETGNDTNIVTIGYQQSADVLLGDVNLDGTVNLLDVAPFVNLLSSGNYQAEADINSDGAVNLLDVAGFVELLSN